jgi:hypothetical protein
MLFSKLAGLMMVGLTAATLDCMAYIAPTLGTIS